MLIMFIVIIIKKKSVKVVCKSRVQVYNALCVLKCAEFLISGPIKMFIV